MTIYYLLTNRAMPGLVKIGQTNKTVNQRIKALYSTGVPTPFVCQYAVEVPSNNKENYEKLMHDALDTLRYNPDREFFEIPVDDAISLMKMIPGTPLPFPSTETRPIAFGLGEEISPDDLQTKKQRPQFRFSMIGLKVGDPVAYRDDISVVAVVCDDKNVMYNETKMSLSKAAKIIGGSDVSGPRMWKYHGEILDNIRTRMEKEAEDSETRRINIHGDVGINGKTGEKCQSNGLYQAECCHQENIAIKQNDFFPPCSIGYHGVSWRQTGTYQP